MYWRLRDLPELQYLPEAQRLKLLRQCVGWFVVARAIGYCVAVSFIFGCLLSAFLQMLFTGVMGMILGIISFGIITAALYLSWLHKTRQELRRFLSVYAPPRELPMCLGCGYNLEGVVSDHCPECGLPLTPASSE